MADELSLVIENPHEGEFLKQIDWNKNEFMELVASITEQYEGLSYTEAQMKAAKSDRARLNAMRKAISDRRIQVKKAVMEPYSKFEVEVAEVVALIDKPISMIDKQIREYEDRTKAEKKAALKKYFEESASALEGILTFDRVFDQRYLNVSVSLNKAKKDIKGKVDRVNTDLRSLEEFCEDKYLTIAKDVYIRTLNVSDALAEAKRLQEFDRKAEEERLRREEEAKIAAESKKKISVSKTSESVSRLPKTAAKEEKSVSEPAEPVSKGTENVTTQTDVIPPDMPSGMAIDTPDTSASVNASTIPVEDTKPCKASFTVYGTKAQIMALRDYMIGHKIKFGKVEK